MSNFLTSSIGKKLIMSISGFFLIAFLALHLTVNLMLMFPGNPGATQGELFNTAAHFMDTNVLIQIMQPVLAIGFIIHILYASILTLQNKKARPVAYGYYEGNAGVKWASQNMYILGGLVLSFLVLHIANFFYHIKFETGVIEKVMSADGKEMDNTYKLVASQLTTWWLGLIYVISAIFLGLHLSHGFWSAFQTIGWSGSKWRTRLENVGYFIAILFGGGFAIIPLVLMIQKYMGIITF